jgi:retinol-binding protein 3
MKRICRIIPALLLLAGVPVAAQVAFGPVSADDPRAVLAAGFVEPLLASDSAAAAEYLRRHAASTASPDSLAAQLGRLTDVLRSHGSATITEYLVGPAGEVGVRLSGGAPLLVIVTTGEPARIARVVPARTPGAASPQPVTAEVSRSVAENVAALVERMYVLPDTARLLAAHLRTRAAAGAFDDAADNLALGGLLSAEMRTVSGDRHLAVRAGPGGGGPGGPMRRPDGAGEAPSGPAAIGFTRVERLDGNVGYVELAGPLGRPGGTEADAAVIGEMLRGLDGTDVVILDLRRSPGGSAVLANVLLSHFLPAGVHSLSVHSRETGETVHRHTLAEVPGPRRTEVPLYVLTSERTFSAGEDIAFVLKSQGRAMLVGERTAGGGRNNAMVPLGHGLVASISVTRVFDPRTGQEAWEHVGVAPDVEVAADDALAAALRHAGKPLGR